MNELIVSPTGRDDAHELVGKGVPSGDWLPTVRSPTLIRDPDGRPLLLTIRYPESELAPLRRAMRGYPMNTVLRAAGIRNKANVFGYSARQVVMQRNACRQCRYADWAPEAHAGLLDATAIISELFRQHLPEVAERDEAAAAEAILPDWRMRGTQWTSGVLNDTAPMPYHYDRNNLGDSWSGMVVVRRGIRGGHLHIPELGAVVDCRDGDIVLFQGTHFLHGVTPMRKVTPTAYRFSAVNYTVNRMRSCLPPEEEMAFAQRNRTEREDSMAAGLSETTRPSGLVAAFAKESELGRYVAGS